MGKTWYLTHNFTQAIFITFVKSDKLQDHIKDIVKNQNKNVEILVLKKLKPKKIPSRNGKGKIDLIVFDCSNFKRCTVEFQQFLIDFANKNSKYYSSIVIDETHNLLPSSQRTSKNSLYLKHFLEARNYGQRTVIATQKPQLVSQDALEMCQVIICFKILGRLAINKIDEILQNWGIDSFIEDNKKLKKHEYNIYKPNL